MLHSGAQRDREKSRRETRWTSEKTWRWMTSPENRMYHTKINPALQCWVSNVVIFLLINCSSFLPAISWYAGWFAHFQSFFSFYCLLFHHTDAERRIIETKTAHPLRTISLLSAFSLATPLFAFRSDVLTSALFICLEQHAGTGTVSHVLSDMMPLTGIMLLLLMMMMRSNTGQSHIWQNTAARAHIPCLFRQQRIQKELESMPIKLFIWRCTVWTPKAV